MAKPEYTDIFIFIIYKLFLNINKKTQVDFLFRKMIDSFAIMDIAGILLL